MGNGIRNQTYRDWETIEQYREYVNAVKYWQSIKKYDGKRKKMKYAKDMQT